MVQAQPLVNCTLFAQFQSDIVEIQMPRRRGICNKSCSSCSRKKCCLAQNRVMRCVTKNWQKTGIDVGRRDGLTCFSMEISIFPDEIPSSLCQIDSQSYAKSRSYAGTGSIDFSGCGERSG